MPKQLKELRLFSVGTKSAASDTDTPMEAAIYSKNIDALSEEGKCEQAFKLTNTIEQGWWNNEDVEYVGPDKTCRSTSSGDQVLLKNGTKYNCSFIGWEKV